MVVALVSELRRQKSTGSMKINAARAAVVRKPAALISAGVAAEEALGVDGLRVESEGVVRVDWVLDLGR